MFPSQPTGITPQARNLVVPLLVVVGMVAVGIAITGETAFRQAGIATPSLMHYLDKGAFGSTAALWGLQSALIVLVGLLGALRRHQI